MQIGNAAIPVSILCHLSLIESTEIFVPKLVVYRRMPSSGILRRVALVRSDVSEERVVSIIRVTRIGEVGTTLAVTSNLSSQCTSVAKLLLTLFLVHRFLLP
jgi:hypothetical protein